MAEKALISRSLNYLSEFGPLLFCFFIFGLAVRYFFPTDIGPAAKVHLPSFDFLFALPSRLLESLEKQMLCTFKT